jgi:hypothetical protein
VPELDVRTRDRSAVATPQSFDAALLEPIQVPVVTPFDTVSRDLQARAATPWARHPVVLVDPHGPSIALTRSLRMRRLHVVALSARRLEPALFVTGVTRHVLPPLAARPERWRATLLELAAKLEPRPLLLGCSAAGIHFLADAHRDLAPHFDFVGLDRSSAPYTLPDAALRRTLGRGEAALEVQMVRDASGAITGSCVLAWAPAPAPDVLVSSVEGADVVQRSATWMATHGAVGYARLLWAPDRFGRLALSAATTLPGPGLCLAAADGVDFAALTYAAALGIPAAPMRARLELVQRLPCIDCDGAAADAPLVDVPVPLSWRDPLPAVVSWIRALARP